MPKTTTKRNPCAVFIGLDSYRLVKTIAQAITAEYSGVTSRVTKRAVVESAIGLLFEHYFGVTAHHNAIK